MDIKKDKEDKSSPDQVKKIVKVKKPKTKIKRNISTGIAFVNATFNNTIITVTDDKGDVKIWSSSGALGFKGAKKSTPYAAQLVAQAIIRSLEDIGTKKVVVRVKGTGPGKNSSVRVFQNSSLEVVETLNVTPKPHNGVRKKKKYRRR